MNQCRIIGKNQLKQGNASRFWKNICQERIAQHCTKMSVWKERTIQEAWDGLKPWKYGWNEDSSSKACRHCNTFIHTTALLNPLSNMLVYPITSCYPIFISLSVNLSSNCFFTQLPSLELPQFITAQSFCLVVPNHAELASLWHLVNLAPQIIPTYL